MIKIKNYKQEIRHIKAKRRAAKARKGLEVKEVSNDNLNVSSDFNYVIYLAINRDYRERIDTAKRVIEFSKHGFSGKYKFTFGKRYSHTRDRVMLRIYLEEESDWIMLRLCHNLAIDRIHKIKH